MKTVRRSAWVAGFTLLELLVVMVVMSMFLLLTTTVSRDALSLHGSTKARLTTDRHAAAFLRQFEADVSQRVNRADAPVRIEKQQGNDGISFVTLRQGYAIRGSTAERRVSLVSYRIAGNMLERAASGYGFGKAPDRPDEKVGRLALKEVPETGPEPPDPAAFQAIAPGVIRLEFSFLVREGDRTVVLGRRPSDGRQIIAVVATLAVLDPDRRGMLDDSQIGLIAAQFPDAFDNILPMPSWEQIATDLGYRMPGFPPAPLQHVRVYQGIFTFPNLNPAP